LLQERLEEPYLNAGIDKFIWMLPDRWLERPLWDDVLGLATAAGYTGQRLFSGMHHAIAELSRAGNNIMADHVLVEPAWVTECAALFAGLPAYLVGLRCPLEVLVDREASRHNRTLGQAAAQCPLVHAHGIYDFEMDTSLLGPQECAEQVVSFLASGVPPRAFEVLRGRQVL
jgi:chloramphenicol 3-O phosphotransferase